MADSRTAIDKLVKALSKSSPDYQLDNYPYKFGSMSAMDLGELI